MRHITLAIVLLAILGACAPKGGIQGFKPDETLSTASDKLQPAWADDTKAFWVKDGTVNSLGIAQIRGDERPEAALRIAENNAKANIARAIETRMEYIFQAAEENATYEATAAKFIGSEVSSLTANSIHLENRWWKRFAQSQEDGSRNIFYKAYALVNMPESEFKKAVFNAINKGVKKHKLSESFQKQVDRQWDRFVEGDQTNKEADQKSQPAAQ